MSPRAEGPLTLILDSRGNAFLPASFIFPPEIHDRSEMVGRDASRHRAWTLMERARTVLVIQRAYPSQCWTVETRISEVILPHANTTFPPSRHPCFIRLSFPCSSVETSGCGVEIRYNEKQRRHNFAEIRAREEYAYVSSQIYFIVLSCAICEL